MTRSPATLPLISVFRSSDRERYMFMEMAGMDPGRYTGWGDLRIMNRSEAEKGAKDVVSRSLLTFAERDGTDKGRRLKLRGFRPLDHDLVEIRLSSPAELRLTPSCRTAVQHDRLDEASVTVGIDVSSAEFFRHLEEAFAAGIAKRSSTM